MKPLRRFGEGIYKNNPMEGSIYGLACTFSLIEKSICDILRPYKLTPAKFSALMVIRYKGQDKGISQIQVGRHLVVTASNMTRLIDKLGMEGFVERMNLQGDRRVNLVKISKKGLGLLDEVYPAYSKRVEEITRVLSHNERKQLNSILGKWCGQMSGRDYVKT
jgi:DNA-binding MarR family transcriptional regulator